MAQRSLRSLLMAGAPSAEFTQRVLASPSKVSRMGTGNSIAVLADPCAIRSPNRQESAPLFSVAEEDSGSEERNAEER